MSIARSMLHEQSRAVCPYPCCMSMSILHVRVHAPCLCQYPCTYIEMPECRTVWHPVSPVPDWKKLTMLEQVRYRTKLTLSIIFSVRYRTKIRHAGMPMPALVSLMPMPSYAQKKYDTSSSRGRKALKNQFLEEFDQRPCRVLIVLYWWLSIKTTYCLFF